jgi:hypothetical protein
MNRRHRLGLTLALVLTAASAAIADPRPRFGMNAGYRNDEWSVITVQAGTAYELHGAIGDHDIYFFDQQLNVVGASYYYGPECGTVPAEAALAGIYVWDHHGEVFDADSPPPVEVPYSFWLYVDGLESPCVLRDLMSEAQARVISVTGEAVS